MGISSLLVTTAHYDFGLQANIQNTLNISMCRPFEVWSKDHHRTTNKISFEDLMHYQMVILACTFLNTSAISFPLIT